MRACNAKAAGSKEATLLQDDTRGVHEAVATLTELLQPSASGRATAAKMLLRASCVAARSACQGPHLERLDEQLIQCAQRTLVSSVAVKACLTARLESFVLHSTGARIQGYAAASAAIDM